MKPDEAVRLRIFTIPLKPKAPKVLTAEEEAACYLVMETEEKAELDREDEEETDKTAGPKDEVRSNSIQVLEGCSQQVRQALQ